MRFLIVPLAVLVAVFILKTHAQDYTKLVFKDCGSKSIDIQKVDLTPMPVYNPSTAFLTFVALLNRPVKVMQVALNIIRSVSGIALPVKCYIVNGQNVGSCTYPDLCAFLQSVFDEFKPETCPPALAQYGIDCKCPFNIRPQQLNIVGHTLEIPDASKTAASFLASGNFDITVNATEPDSSAPKPYGCGKISFTIKQKK